MGARARARESSGAQLLIIKPSFPSLLPLAAPLLSRGPRPRPRPARSPKAMWGKRTPLIALSKTPRFSSPPVSGARCASDCLLMLVPLPAHVRSGARARELRCRGRRRRGRDGRSHAPNFFFIVPQIDFGRLVPQNLGHQTTRCEFLKKG